MKRVNRGRPLRRSWLFWLGLLTVAAGTFLVAQDHFKTEEQTVYDTDLAAFFKEIDDSYPFFDLKGIRRDWAAAKRKLSEKVKACQSDTEFFGIVVDAIRCLRDPHMRLLGSEAKPPAPPPEYYPGISFLPAMNQGVVVMHPPRGHEAALKTGTVVTKIDGKDARRYLEERAQKAWASGGFFSSRQRARLFEFRIPLRGKEGEKHTITCFSRGKMREIVLTSNIQARGWPHIYNLPAGMKRVGRSFFYTRLPSGAGYMYLRRVDNSVEPGISQALARCAGARGWIIDLCGNGGGGYGASLMQKIRAIPRPIVVIIDAGCMSAGETLARDIARLTGARIFGSKTAGCSSAKRTWDFPSGIASIVIPRRSRWRSDGKPIEFNGIDPHLTVEAVPEEVARGLNSAICRAEQHLRRR